ncbi:MAG: polymer-forming cytoskeletal protein [Angelakisella sp.]
MIFLRRSFWAKNTEARIRAKFETIIGACNAVTGNIEGASPICINGKLIGNINSTSYVYISKTGSIEGNVTANHLVLLGNITGDKVDVSKLVVTATGVINSDIKVARLTVEEGGVLNGQINVTPDSYRPAEE